jgi:hypothetical protein
MRTISAGLLGCLVLGTAMTAAVVTAATSGGNRSGDDGAAYDLVIAAAASSTARGRPGSAPTSASAATASPRSAI